MNGINISDDRDSIECVTLKAFIHKGNSCDHKILNRSAHHSLDRDLSLVRGCNQHHGLLMFVGKILHEDIAFPQKSYDISDDQINSRCDKKDGSGKLFRLLGNKKISHRQQHDHADMLYCFGKFSVISSLQDSLIGLTEKHYCDLAQNKTDCHATVQMIGIEVAIPLPQIICNDERKLQTNNIQQDKIPVL